MIGQCCVHNVFLLPSRFYCYGQALVYLSELLTYTKWVSNE